VLIDVKLTLELEYVKWCKQLKCHFETLFNISKRKFMLLG